MVVIHVWVYREWNSYDRTHMGGGYLSVHTGTGIGRLEHARSRMTAYQRPMDTGFRMVWVGK